MIILIISMDILAWKIKFIQNVIDSVIIFFENGKSINRNEILERLEKLQFPRLIDQGEKSPSYNYLIGISLSQISNKEIIRLEKILKNK